MTRSLALAAGLVVFYLAPASAQSGDVRTSTLAWLQRFVTTAYPEIVQRGVDARLVLPVGHQWTGRIPHVMLAFNEPQLGPPRNRTTEELLAGRILQVILRQSMSGELRSLFAYGTLVDSATTQVLEAEIEKNPAWKAPEIEAFLRRSTLPYGPAAGKEMLESLSLWRFEPLFGRLTVTTMSFLSRDDEAGDETTQLAWRVGVRSENGRTYDIYVEPSAARIKAIVDRTEG